MYELRHNCVCKCEAGSFMPINAEIEVRLPASCLKLCLGLCLSLRFRAPLLWAVVVEIFLHTLAHNSLADVNVIKSAVATSESVSSAHWDIK